MSKNTSKEISGPKSHWLFGLMREFLGDTLGFLQDVRNNYGPVSKFRILRVYNYLISDPEQIEIIFQDKCNLFIKNTGFFRHFYDIFGQGLLTSEGSHWKKNRKLISPVFRPNNISEYVHEFESLTNSEIVNWGSKINLDFHEVAMRLTANIATKTLFGIDNYNHDHKLQRSIRVLEQQIAVRIGRPFIFQDYLPTRSNFQYRSSLRYLERTVQSLIEEFKRNKKGDKSVLSLLVDAKYEDGSLVTKKQLRDEALTLFLAGHDSTAILLSWMFYLVSVNESVLKRLRAEWDTVLGDSEIEFKSLQNLKYTLAVIDETLRLYPPAYIIGRQTTDDYKLGDYVIPAGAPVVISPYVMGRSRKYFENPDEFDPDRWTTEFRNSLPKGAFIPFGGGKRTCIGEYFAKIEAMTVMISILMKYNIKYTGGSDPEPLISINMPPKNGMSFEFTLI